MATYPKSFMTIKELKEMGWTEDELLAIYRNRRINRDLSIAWKTGSGGRTSTIKFDTEALEKYRKSLCTGI